MRSPSSAAGGGAGMSAGAVVRRTAAGEWQAAMIALRRPLEVLAGAPGTDGGHHALVFDLLIVVASADRCEPAVAAAIRGPGAAVSGRGLCARCRAPWRPRRPCRGARGSAALIISHSMRARVGMQLVVQRHGDHFAVGRPGPEDRHGAEDRLRDGVGRQRRVGLGERDHPPDFVLQLADVARPAVEQEAFERFLGDGEAALVELLGGAFDEVVDEARGFRRAVRGAGGMRQGDDVEPVEEVFAEASVADRVVEVRRWWRR